MTATTSPFRRLAARIIAIERELRAMPKRRYGTVTTVNSDGTIHVDVLAVDEATGLATMAPMRFVRVIGADVPQVGDQVALTHTGDGRVTYDGRVRIDSTPIPGSTPPYVPPAVVLSTTPAATVRELGSAAVATVALSAVTTIGTNPITDVRFKRAGSVIHTTTPPATPAGPTSTDAFTDPTSTTTTTSWTAEASDDSGATWHASNAVAQTFVYPIFEGSAAAGLGAGTQNTTTGIYPTLTKHVATALASVTYSPAGQKMYYVRPVAAGALTSIKDPSSFELIGSFTRTTVSITGLDTTAQSYYVYESNLPVTLTAYTLTFV